MIWLAWRQFRIQALVAIGALVLVAAVLAATDQHMTHIYQLSGLASCTTAVRCSSARSTFFDLLKADTVYPALFFVGIGIMYLGLVLIGMFWGAPLVTRELEAGTFRLTWTQSVTRVRWLLVRLGIVGASGALFAGLLSWAVTWWSSPIDRADALPGLDAQAIPNRFAPLIFGARGIAPIGYAVFAFVLGVTIGVLVRRTLPAMAVTLAVFGAVQIAVPMAVRAHYAAPEHTSTALAVTSYGMRLEFSDTSMSVSVPVNIPGAWVTSTRTVAPDGRPFTGPAPQICLAQTHSDADCLAAIDRLGLRQLVDYQPADRFWTFQWDELAVYLGLASVTAGVCVWRIRRLRLA